ncbi:MAG: hypothetical protein EBX44_14675, partial [Betaproteobacteria bacterium]|nr:hypothetical protein [Betaproteobacteria bacterium]
MKLLRAPSLENRQACLTEQAGSSTRFAVVTAPASQSSGCLIDRALAIQFDQLEQETYWRFGSLLAAV